MITIWVISLRSQYLTPLNFEIESRSFPKGILDEGYHSISFDLHNLEKNNKVSQAINDFVKSLKIYFRTGKLNINGIKIFKTFWGHGTSQISMLKY